MDLDVYLRFVLALVFVLALIGLIAYVGRRMGFIGKVSVRAGGRLSVVDSIAIDSKRRLILVKRDDVEHLVLLGPASEVVVEDGIKKGVP